MTAIIYDAAGQIMPVLWSLAAEDLARGWKPLQHYDPDQIRDASEGHCPYCRRPLRRATGFAQGVEPHELLKVTFDNWAACWACDMFWRVTTTEESPLS